MTVVFEMSTDADIQGTALDPAWPAVTARYGWNQVSQINLGLAGGQTIVVIAHGDGTEIGNAQPGTIDINAAIFLALIQGNTRTAQAPAAIYLSTCGPGIAEFAAHVRLLAERNEIWHATEICGHARAAVGPVPPPGDAAWVEIF